MQIFKLGGVIISTAGSNFILSGINKEKADKIVSAIINDKVPTNIDKMF